MREFHRYKIAFRENPKDEFKIVENPEYGWLADPFPVMYKDKLYVFAEVFLYKTERNGKLAYSIYEEGKFSAWNITMDKHWHLSYPNVFVREKDLYMVPESYQLGEVNLYRLHKFPNEWKKVETIVDNVEYVDSTFVECDGKIYMFTFETVGKGPDGRLWLYEICNGIGKKIELITERLDGARCGGRIIKEGDKYTRVAQNCIPEYGSGLIFYEIDRFSPSYREHEVKRISVEDIKPEWKNEFVGIHTYNRLGNFEIIDLREAVRSEEEEIASNRVRQIFTNKYRREV